MREDVTAVPIDFMAELREMRNENKEGNQNIIKLTGSLETFMKTEALEKEMIKRDVRQCQKDIAELKADKKFVARTAIAEVIKYAVIGGSMIIAAVTLKGGI